MPFLPPAVSMGRPRSACGVGLTGEDPRAKRLSLPETAFNKTRATADDKGRSVKERLALNLRHLGRKSHPKSHLPTAKVVAAPALHVKSRDQWLPPSPDPSGVPRAPSRAAQAMSKIPLYGHIRHDVASMKSNVQGSSGAAHREEASFTLTLTPEAVELLKRRSAEGKRRAAAKSTAAKSTAAAAGAPSESGSKRPSPSKRQAPLPPQHATPCSGATARTGGKEAAPGDIRSIVKISLLNKHHRYDDVEYEEEGDRGADEHVVLKCTEWLRGLENAPVAGGNGASKGTAIFKSL